MQSIGQLLAAAREAAGMTQAQVAAARHVSRGAQSQIELTGASPTWDTIDSFARAIDSSVSIRFELANGREVEGLCGGTRRHTLATDLIADAETARKGAIEAGWTIEKDEVHRSSVGYGEFPTVNRLVSIIEPTNWHLQNSLTLLMSVASAEGMGRKRGSEFSSEFHSLLLGPRDDDEISTFDVTTESQVALNALLYAIRHICRLIEVHAKHPLEIFDVLPVRNLHSYLSAGAPGAAKVSELVDRIASSAEWRLSILRQAGYLHGEPSDYSLLPHIVLEV
jgi:transcriptional regulator with XRE-family HTH domain